MRNQDKKNPSSSNVQGPASSVEVSEDQSGATLWNNPQTRRRFLRRSGAAAAGTILAMEGLRLEVSAQTSSGDGPKIKVDSVDRNYPSNGSSFVVVLEISEDPPIRDILRCVRLESPSETDWEDSVDIKYRAKAMLIRQTWDADESVWDEFTMAETDEATYECTLEHVGEGEIEVSNKLVQPAPPDGSLSINIAVPVDDDPDAVMTAAYHTDSVAIDFELDLATQ